MGSRTARAVVYTQANQLELQDIPRYSCRPGEVALAVEAVGVCRTDHSILSGKHMRATPPLILGHEFAGRVIETGSEVFDLTIGDMVSVFPLRFCGHCETCGEGKPYLCKQLQIIGIDCNGGMTEEICIPGECAFKLPQSVDAISGALVEPMAVAVHAVRQSGVIKGERVVVLGAGVIGQCLLQVLRARGIQEVAVLDRTDNKLKMADQLVALTSSLDETGSRDIIDWTGGMGADVVFEATGASPVIPLLTSLSRSGGRIIVVGIQEGATMFDLRDLFFKELTMIASRLYLYGDFAEVLDLIGHGAIHPKDLVTHVFSLADADKAFEVAKSRHSLKVIIQPSANS